MVAAAAIDRLPEPGVGHAAGAGFAVVADEVRDLAGRTVDALVEAAQRSATSMSKVRSLVTEVHTPQERSAGDVARQRRDADAVGSAVTAANTASTTIHDVSTAAASGTARTQEPTESAGQLATAVRGTAGRLGELVRQFRL